MLEIKSVTGEIKDIDTAGRHVTKYVSAFNNIDSHGDIMQKGAYTKTIKENKDRVKYLWNHDSSNMPVGKVVEMSEDDFGLKATSKIADTPRGNELLTLYAEGIITEHSVGFFTKNKKSNPAGNRIITEVQLLEYSAVNWGSNPNTPVLGIKSANVIEQLAELDKRSQKLYKALTTANKLTDETFEMLGLEHANITRMMSEIIDSLKAKEPETISTQVEDKPIENESKSIDYLATFLGAYKK